LLGVPKPTGHLAVPLSSVCNEWVQEVRIQLAEVEIEQSQILVPLEILEPAMKSGKVLFFWEEVAAWIQPPLAIPPTRKVGEMTVDLPLKVLAPLFMAHHRSGAQQRVALDETIPDLFGGGNAHGSTEAQIVSTAAPVAPAARSVVPAQPATPPIRVPVAMPKLEMATPKLEMMPEPTPVAPAPAPVAIAPAPVTTPAHQEISLESIVGNGTGHFSVKEIVANTAKLPGLSGALLAMNDGLLVTSQTPPNVKAETIAAFLPQMFGRMNQYTKELALGPLKELALTVEGGQWHVIKCDIIYFAVLGKHGEPLPLNTLAQVAAELSNQSK
jgi:predicted regulator of Ras-like GTPase activity (Roadblock/LC7/MglB family)